ncbi:MAG: hypothetical protein GY853_13965 [PVC group bacterium]|nr:hypothetical protein [PVC group bacterium]
MNKTQFDKRIKQLVVELNLLNSPNARTDKLFADTILWPYVEKYSYEKLDNACNWLKLNHDSKYNKFPNMYDFRQAVEATKKTCNTFDPGKKPTGQEQAEVRKIAGELAKKFNVRGTK